MLDAGEPQNQKTVRILRIVLTAYSSLDISGWVIEPIASEGLRFNIRFHANTCLRTEVLRGGFAGRVRTLICLLAKRPKPSLACWVVSFGPLGSLDRVCRVHVRLYNSGS